VRILIYILLAELKEELSDFDGDKDDSDVVGMLGLKDITVKKRSLTKKKNGKKRTILEKNTSG
jgi:hypothetical protein